MIDRVVNIVEKVSIEIVKVYQNNNFNAKIKKTVRL
jgi:hypothetical protein